MSCGRGRVVGRVQRGNAGEDGRLVGGEHRQVLRGAHGGRGTRPPGGTRSASGSSRLSGASAPKTLSSASRSRWTHLRSSTSSSSPTSLPSSSGSWTLARPPDWPKPRWSNERPPKPASKHPDSSTAAPGGRPRATGVSPGGDDVCRHGGTAALRPVTRPGTILCRAVENPSPSGHGSARRVLQGVSTSVNRHRESHPAARGQDPQGHRDLRQGVRRLRRHRGR